MANHPRRPSHRWSQLDTARWGWRTPLGTSSDSCHRWQSCPRCTMSQDQKRSFSAWASLLRLSTGKITPGSVFSNWKWLCFCCYRGCSLAGSPGTTGNGLDRRCRRAIGISWRGKRKGGNTLSASPAQPAQGKPICQSDKWPFPFTCD